MQTGQGRKNRKTKGGSKGMTGNEHIQLYQSLIEEDYSDIQCFILAFIVFSLISFVQLKKSSQTVIPKDGLSHPF